MLDAVLKKRGTLFRISVKSGITVLMIVLAVALPHIVHVAGGATAGAKFMPMYAPVLLAGCLLGWKWGLAAGLISPLVSFLFTYLALGSAMPAAEKLPFMVVELGVFGFVSGLFARKIAESPFVAFPAVITAQLSGRAVFVLTGLIAGSDFGAAISVLQTGIIGLVIQAVAIPLTVIIFSAFLRRDKKE